MGTGPFTRANPAPAKGTLGRCTQRLSAQHELFVDALVNKNMTATQAAIAAGCSKKSAGSIGCQWLNSEKYPQIAILIQKRKEELRKKSSNDAERILHQLRLIGEFNPQDILTDDGKGVLDLKDLPRDVAMVVKNINVTYGEDVDDEGNYTRVKHVSYTLHDKMTALRQWADMLGLSGGGTIAAMNEQRADQLKLDWDDLYKKAQNQVALPTHIQVEVDPIEARILSELLPPQETSAQPCEHDTISQEPQDDSALVSSDRMSPAQETSEQQLEDSALIKAKGELLT